MVESEDNQNVKSICGSTNKQIRGRKAREQGKYGSCQIFLAKQMHFCLASRVSKFRANTRNRKVS